MKTLVEVHALQNFAPSNLNRDDTGAPKDALFGGTRRARVSSQCSKRAIRQYFRALVQQQAWDPSDLGIRTKRAHGELADALVAAGRDRDQAEAKVRTALAAVALAVKDDGKTEYLLFLGRKEIETIAQAIHENWDEIGDAAATANDEPKPGRGKKRKANGVPAEATKAIGSALDGGKAVDIALFGRMLADMPRSNQDAACQVAHAISTHVVEREFDFYTAVDDLKPDDTSGADMMGTIEFVSACFYRYAVVDWEKLVSNLQGDGQLAARGLNGFLEGFVVAEPTGKQNSFAAHNPCELVMVTVRRDGAPRNLANAFEVPIAVQRGQSLTRLSAEALGRKAALLEAAYGGVGETFILNPTGVEVDAPGQRVGSLQELLARVQQAVRP